LNQHLINLLPPEGIRIVLTLFLSFLIGLEREEQKAIKGYLSFGGVRTFPLIGLMGYALALISGDSQVPVTAGFVVVAAFLLLSYQHKLEKLDTAGVTTEISGLTTYIIGAVVAHDRFWIATTLAVVSLLLLELKSGLESLSKRLPTEEIFTFTKFLLLTAVILPVVPNRDFGPFQFNPFKAWLVVAAVSAVSYASYILQVRTQGQSGILLIAVLGGIYSSTVSTVVLAKRARTQQRPHLFSGGIVISSAVMYVRILVLVGIFNVTLMKMLAPSFLALAAIGTLGGWLWSRRTFTSQAPPKNEVLAANPLELSSALLFGGLFVVMLALTHYAVTYLGRGGVYVLAGLTGFTDVAPFIMGITQTAGQSTPLMLAAGGIIVAAASNNVVKGGYAVGFADRQTGRESLVGLLLLAAAGCIPLIWL
jgi:uncharacterized membrane protein (DUF4010 family)